MLDEVDRSSIHGCEHDDGDAGQRHDSSGDVPHRRPDALHHPEPHDGDDDVYPAVRRIDTPRRRRVEREQPGEQRQTERCRNEQQRALALPEPEVGQVAPDDLRHRRHDEEQHGPELWHHRSPTRDFSPRRPSTIA